MSIANVVGAILSVLLVVFLLIALVAAERF